jgi:hypothetical protein
LSGVAEPSIIRQRWVLGLCLEEICFHRER